MTMYVEFTKVECNSMKYKNQETVDVVEKNYPEMTKAFLDIQREQYETFCSKQLNYGPGNISVGTELRTPEEVKLSLTGLWFRMTDKINRLKQLVLLGHQDAVGESVADTFMDLSVYGIIALIVSRGKWGK